MEDTMTSDRSTSGPRDGRRRAATGIGVAGFALSTVSLAADFLQLASAGARTILIAVGIALIVTSAITFAIAVPVGNRSEFSAGCKGAFRTTARFIALRVLPGAPIYGLLLLETRYSIFNSYSDAVKLVILTVVLAVTAVLVLWGHFYDLTTRH